MDLGNLGKMIAPTKLGRNAETAVADHEEVAIKPVGGPLQSAGEGGKTRAGFMDG